MGSALTEEHADVFGSPTETMVQETCYVLHDRLNKPYLWCEQVAAELVEWLDITPTEAQERIQQAIVAGEVDVCVCDSGEARISLDPLVDLRIERRMNFWTLYRSGKGAMPPSYEGMFQSVCSVLADWCLEFEEPPDYATTIELLEEAAKPFKNEDVKHAAVLHALLNALDAGADPGS